MTHRDVVNAAVIGVKDVDRGQVPRAFVTVVNGSVVSAQQLVDYVDSRVDEYKKLRGGARILDSLPMTSSQKINKPALRTMITEINK